MPHITPYLVMVLAGVAVFVGFLGTVSIRQAIDDARAARAKRLPRP
jgi:hypothetical protein